MKFKLLVEQEIEYPETKNGYPFGEEVREDFRETASFTIHHNESLRTALIKELLEDRKNYLEDEFVVKIICDDPEIAALFGIEAGDI